MKKINIILLILTMAINFSCQSSVQINPVDDSKNNSAIKVLQKNGSTAFIYYEIDDFKNLSPQLLANEISDYLKNHNLEKEITNKKNEVYCFFYQKKLFKNYKKLLGDQESISDSGSFFDESENMVALVIFSFVDNQCERDITIYQTGSEKTKILFEDKQNINCQTK